MIKHPSGGPYGSEKEHLHLSSGLLPLCRRRGLHGLVCPFRNSTYHLNVSEAVVIPSEKLKSARLFGVADGDITKPANGLGASFTLRDLEKPADAIYVQYKGALPDTFEKGAEVIVEGRMDGKVFMAKTLMTKCPSKYEKTNREKA